MKRIIVVCLTICVLLSCVAMCSCRDSQGDNEKDNIPQDEEMSPEEVYALVSPSVVKITGKNDGEDKVGIGFFYDERGTVVTNYHVIRNCQSAKITLADGTSYAVEKVLGYSIEKDVVILSTQCSTSTPAVIRPTTLGTREAVYAIGYSATASDGLSAGTVLSSKTTINGKNYIRTTASVTQENGGGPLVDKNGKVAGMTNATAVDEQGFSLATPVKEIKSISIENPITLEELFKVDATGLVVEQLLKWELVYNEEENVYSVVFELADKNGVSLPANGSINMHIMNNNGEVVYQKTKTFTTNDFKNSDSYGMTYFATINIPVSEISTGKTSQGIMRFTIQGETFKSDEITLIINTLPNAGANLNQIPASHVWNEQNKANLLLAFQLSDQTETPTPCGGTVKIRIVNSDDMLVYYEIISFTEDDYQIWNNDKNDAGEYFITIPINKMDLARGNSSEGTVFFTVQSENRSYEECSLAINGLPIQTSSTISGTIAVPACPIFTDDPLGTSARIDSVTYETLFDGTFCFYFSGEKIADYDGNESDSVCFITWELYDSQDTLVASKTACTQNLLIGERFENVKSYVWDGIIPGEQYSLIIVCENK